MFSYIYILVSMLLDSTISNYISYDINNLSLFNPVFTIVSLSVVYLFFLKKTYVYIKTVVIFSIIYSTFFTGNAIVNMFAFFFIALLNVYIYNYVYNNIINTIFICIMDIFLYYIVSYIIYSVFNIYNYSIWYLFNVLKNSILLNIMYCFFSYKILKHFYNKKLHKKILS